MYSIVTISGKQYCVSEGDTIKVSSQDWKVGDRVKLDQVLLTDNGKNIEFGTPKVNGASVTVEILEHNRQKKLLIYKKKRRKGYQRKNGHRQQYSLIKINKIYSKDGGIFSEAKKLEKKIVKKENIVKK